MLSLACGESGNAFREVHRASWREYFGLTDFRITTMWWSSIMERMKILVFDYANILLPIRGVTRLQGSRCACPTWAARAWA